MKKKCKKIASLAIIASIILPYVIPTRTSAYDFNPNHIISDEEYLDYGCMGLEEIQTFLEKKNSGLANYKTEDIDGKVKNAAEIIYRSSQDYKISPKFLLVLLQKEQSLIETATPTPYQLDWATGFARCDDPVACSPEAVSEYKGFTKQVDRAAWRNRFYLENSYKDWLKKANLTYKIDGYDITPVNQATANLYNYTPHYNGNYNFWKIWNRYFSKNYPNGSLLQVPGDDTIYLIDYGMRRPFLSKTAFLSRFSKDRIISVREDDILRYDLGAPLKFPNYSLVRAPSKVTYLLINDKKHKIVSPAVFKKIGFIDDEIVDLPEEEINGYTDGESITMESIYPLGALLRDKKNGGVYYVENGIKNPIWDKTILKTNYSNKKIIETDHDEIEKLKNGWPIKFKDGELVKANGDPSVYVISNGQRRPITSGLVFETLGYKWKNVIKVDKKVLLALHPLGDMIDIGEESLEIEEGTLVKTKNNPAVYIVENKILRPILSEDIFKQLNFEWSDIKVFSETIINSLSLGSAIDVSYNPKSSSKLAKGN